jgi:hypothetical protein
VTAGEQWTSWAELAERLPLASTGWACKVFARDLETVEILDTDSLSVAIAAAPRPMTFGLWFNAGGWPTGDPLHHVGIEPGFGDHDDLGAASACKTSLTVEPSDAVHWTVAVRAGVA